MPYTLRDLANHLDRRRPREADVEWMVYDRPGTRVGTHVVRTAAHDREVTVGSIADRSYIKGQTVPVGSHTGTDGGRVILGSPPPERRGTSAAGIIEVAGDSGLPPPAAAPDVLSAAYVGLTFGGITVEAFAYASDGSLSGSLGAAAEIAGSAEHLLVGSYVIWRDGSESSDTIKSWHIPTGAVATYTAAAGRVVCPPTSDGTSLWWVEGDQTASRLRLYTSGLDLSGAVEVTSHDVSLLSVSAMVVPSGTMFGDGRVRSEWRFGVGPGAAYHEIAVRIASPFGLDIGTLTATNDNLHAGLSAFPGSSAAAGSPLYGNRTFTTPVNLSRCTDNRGYTSGAQGSFAQHWPTTGPWAIAADHVAPDWGTDVFLAYESASRTVIVASVTAPGTDPDLVVTLEGTAPDRVFFGGG